MFELQCVAVCVALRCSALQCVAVCYSVLQCQIKGTFELHCVSVKHAQIYKIKAMFELQCVAVCCSVLQCVAVCRR